MKCSDSFLEMEAQFFKKVLLDLFSIRFWRRGRSEQPQFYLIFRGRTKPLYEAPDLTCHQINQSGHQIGGN